MVKFRSVLAGLLISTAAVAFTGSARAAIVNSGDLTVTEGQNSLATETHIFLDATINSTVQGHVGSQTGDAGTPLITFTANTPVDAKNGFASIDATPVHTVYNTLTVSVATGFTFTDLVFDVLQPNDFTVSGSNGGFSTITNPDPGLNEYTALAINGTNLTSLTLHSDLGFTQIKQFEISGLTAPVPEPSTWAMMILGFAGVGFMAYRRRNGALHIA
jgi:hypothetical protein